MRPSCETLRHAYGRLRPERMYLRCCIMHFDVRDDEQLRQLEQIWEVQHHPIITLLLSQNDPLLSFKEFEIDEPTDAILDSLESRILMDYDRSDC